MNTKQLKKRLILNVPYILVGMAATNLGEAWRLAGGVNASQKVQSLVLDGVFGRAFSNPYQVYFQRIFWLVLSAEQRSGWQCI